jgi:DNA-binding cell septation regulator SpoVG
MQVSIAQFWPVAGKRGYMRAKFAVRLNSTAETGLTVYHFRLMEGRIGNYWLSVPQRRVKGGEWEKLVTLSADLHQAVLEAAVKVYAGPK